MTQKPKKIRRSPERGRRAGQLAFALPVRFTQSQRELLEAIADEAGRPMGALVRDVVAVWALNHGLVDEMPLERRNELVREMVAELVAVEEQA